MRILKLLKTAMIPQFWPALKFGVLPTLEHVRVFDGLLFGTVIDVGANKGQFSLLSRYLWPQAKIIGFEPQPDQASIFRKLNLPQTELMEFALGTESSKTELHIASRKDSSSLLPLGNEQKEIFGVEEVGTIEVDVKRLDQVVTPADLVGPTLMKIDVQGFEHQVLEGATALLPSIDYIYLELSLVELYVGQKLYEDVKALLQDSGFDELSEKRVSSKDDIQFDAMFQRR
jgi:FkbM family methyltransferase